MSKEEQRKTWDQIVEMKITYRRTAIDSQSDFMTFFDSSKPDSCDICWKKIVFLFQLYVLDCNFPI